MLPVQLFGGRPQGRFNAALLLGVAFCFSASALCFSASAFAQSAVNSAKTGVSASKRVAKADDRDKDAKVTKDKKDKASPKTVKYGHEAPKPAPPGVKTVKIDGEDLGVFDRNSVSFMTRFIEAMKEKLERENEKREKTVAPSGKSEPDGIPARNEAGEKIVLRPDTARDALRKRSGIRQKPETEKEGLDRMEAWLYYLKPRAFPNDKIDGAAIRQGLIQRDKMSPARILTGGRGALSSRSRGAALAPAGSGPTWEFLGPKNATPPWQFGAGPPDAVLSGRINAIAFDPATKGTVYVASPSGGIWKTTNLDTVLAASQTPLWTPLGDNLSSLKFTSLAIGNDGAVYAGMGDYFGEFSSPYSKGIMRSRDGGATWQNVGASVMTGMSVSAIAVDPDDPRIVMATTGRGDNPRSFLFRSTNGGDTFQRIGIRGNTGQGDWNDVRISPVLNSRGQRIYYAALASPATGGLGQLWRSLNRGATWSVITSAPHITPYIQQYHQFVIAPSPAVGNSVTDGNVVYMVQADGLFGTGRISKGLYDPTTDTYSWTDITGNFDAGTQSSYWEQGFYNIHAHVGFQGATGAQQDVLYTGVLGFAGAVGGGPAWTDISRTYLVETDAVGNWTASDDTFHTDQHSMAIDPFDPNGAIVGSDGGIYYLKFDPTQYDPATPDQNVKAWTLTSLNATLGVTEFYFGDFHPTDPAIMLGGTQDNSTPNSTGDLNNWTNVGVGDGGGSAIVSAKGGVAQFSTSQGYGFVGRTNDNWRTRWFNGFPWDNLFGGMAGEYITPGFSYDYTPFVGPLYSDDGTGSVYLLTDYLWRWDEPQHRWFGHLGGINFSAFGLCTAMGIAPSDSKRLYLGTTEGLLWMSKNQGATWYQIVGNSGTNAFRTISGISVNPNNPADVILTYSGTGTAHVWRCANVDARPVKFVSISGFGASGLPDIPTNTVARDLNDPNNGFFVGTDIGVFYSADGGKTWGDATTPLGLPNVRVNVLKAVPGTGYLNAVTYGRGMWRLPLNPGATVPIADPVKISVAISKPAVQNGVVTALLTVSNNSDVLASAIQIKDIQAVFGTNAVKGAPIPLNIGTIPGQRNGKTYSVNRSVTFPAAVAGPGDAVTVTFKGIYVQTGPHPFTLTATVIMP